MSQEKPNGATQVQNAVESSDLFGAPESQLKAVIALLEPQYAMAVKLIEVRNMLKRLHGDRWSERMQPLRAKLRELMDVTGNNNPLAVAIPAAKEMSAAGENPMLLIAVAVDMAAPNDKAEPRRKRDQ